METAILAIFLFAVLIFPHELGHFIAAKLNGVRVNEFAFGMGPAIFKKQKGETLYSIRVFPIGGYCAMEGEDEESDNERAFGNQGTLPKIIILAAGAFMNLVICIVVMSFIIGIAGIPTDTVQKVHKGMPAASSGIEAGDRLVSVNGNKIEDWSQFQKEVASSDSSSELKIGYERDGSTRTSVLKPKKVDDSYVIGISPVMSHNPIKAVGKGFVATGNMTKSMYKGLKMLVTGQVSAKQVSGPVGIITIVHDQGTKSVSVFFYILALMSLNLAIVNMLPLPALDGGRILFTIVRHFAGGKITDKGEGMVHLAGMVMLLLLMVVVTWNDIVKIFAK